MAANRIDPLIRKLQERYPYIEWSIEHVLIRGNETPVIVGHKDGKGYALSLGDRAGKRVNEKLIDTVAIHVVARFGEVEK